MFSHSTIPKDKIIRQALNREGRSGKKQIDRMKHFRPPALWGIWLLWGIFVGVLIYVAGFSSWLTVTTISVTGVERVPRDRVMDTVEGLLAGRYWRVWPRNNFFFIPRETLRATVLDMYPLIAMVDITRKFPNQLSLAVQERSRLVLWCSAGPCYTVDQQGMARTNERLLYTLYDPWRLQVIDTSGLPVEIGQAVAVEPYLAYFEHLFHASEKVPGLTLAQAAYTSSQFSRELRVQVTAGWTLMVNIDIPVEDTLAALNTLLAHRSTQTETRALATVDMRVPGRIFFSVIDEVTGEAGALEILSTASDREGSMDQDEQKHEKKSKKRGSEE